MEDRQIIDLLFERSEQAVGELDRKYGPAVRRVALNILGDRQDAEECVNDAWLGVWNTIPPQRPMSLAAYVCRVARNQAAKRYHANTAQKRNSHYDAALDELAECLAAPEGVEEVLEARELGAAISAFLDTVSREDRVLFMRRYWYADGLEAIAARTGLSRRYISLRLFRTRERLRKYLLKEGMLT